MIANAPLAVQATKESALKGLYVDEDAITQVREAARALRAALEQIDGSDPGHRAGRDRGERRGAHQARQGVAHRVREGEPHLERDLPDRGRQGRSEGVRREAKAGLERRQSGESDPARSIRGTPCIIGVAANTWHPEVTGEAGAPEPLEMWEHVARLAERDAGSPGCSPRSTASRSCTARPGSTTTRSPAGGRARRRSAPSPLLRHRRHDHAAARQRHVRGDAARRDGSRADHERRGAGHEAAAQAAGRALRRRRSRPPNVRRSRGSRRPIPIEVAHEVFQAWLTFAVFDNARRARPRDRPRRVPPRDRRDARTDDADRGAQPARLVPRRAVGRRDRRTSPRQPDGRLPVHQVHGVGDGRRHGRRARARHARARRRARHPARSARVPARLVLRARSGARRRAPRSRGVRRRWRPRAPRRCGSPAHRSTTSRFFDLYSCFASSLHFACDALGIAPTIPAASPSPAVCRITAVRRAGTSRTRSRRWSSGCAPSPTRPVW